MKVVLKITAVLLIFLASPLSGVEIVGIENSEVSSKLSEEIRKVVPVDDKTVILLGRNNIKKAEQYKAKTLAALITRNEFYKLNEDIQKKVKPIFSDPSPEQQLSLIKYIWGKRQRKPVVGVILSDESEIEHALKKYAEYERITLQTIHTNDNPAKAITRTHGIDFLLAIPDPKIYNSKTLRLFITSAHQKKIPIIGFYTAMVKAGGIATTYNSLEDITKNIVNDIKRGVEHSSFSIEFNIDSARSYGYTDLDKNQAKKYIKDRVTGYRNDKEAL